MTFAESTYTMRVERSRLDKKLDEYAEKLADIEDDTASGQAIMREANDHDVMLSGVEYLIDEYGGDATVEVGGLTSGEYARVEDWVAKSREQAGGSDVPGVRRNVFSAAGLQEAPFLDADALEEAETPREELEVKVGIVSNLPLGCAKWLQDRVNEETSLGNSKPLVERLLEKSSN